MISRRVLGLLLTVAFAVFTPAPSQAQSPTEPVVEVNLYGSTVLFRTLPFSLVGAERASPSGERAEGIGFAGEDGVAQVQFLDGGAVRPGDTLTFTDPGGEPIVITVPTLAVRADLETDRVIGLAPAGVEVLVTVESTSEPPTSLERTVTADADGSFALELAGALDMQPGAVTGMVSVVTGGGAILTRAPFAALAMEVTVGASTVSGRATPGTSVEVVREVGGVREPVGTVEVLENGLWTAGQPMSEGRIEAGQTVIVTQSGGLLSESAELRAVVQDVEVVLNPQSESVSGVGPAGMNIRLAGDAMDGEAFTRTALSGAGGEFAVDLDGQFDIGAGWRVRADYEAAPAVRVGALGVLRKARIGIGIPIATGRAEPGLPITATLRTGSGVVKAQNRTAANDRGEYQLFLGGFGPGGPRVAPGDMVELEFVDGDPLALPVPDLTATSDVAGNAVFGLAPAGSTVRVDVTTDPAAPRLTAVADSAGEYQAAFGDWELTRPTNGSVTYVLPNGNEFWASWAAIQLTAAVGNALQPSFVVGNGPQGANAVVELVDPDGRVVGSGESPVFGGLIVVNGTVAEGSQFFTQLADVTGMPVEMQPGDTLRVVAGSEEVELDVPPLDALVLVQANTVTGRTAPNAAVRIQISRDGSRFDVVVDVVADAQGTFAHDFTGDYEIRYGDQVLLQAEVDDHLLLNLIVAPGLLVELDQSFVLGSISPNVAVDATLTRGGAVISQSRSFADGAGFFALLVADEAGAPIVFAEGDVLEVVPDDPSVDTLTMTMPRLDIDYSVAADTVNGMSTPGGQLTMLATEAYFRGDSLGIAQAWPAIGDSAAFSANFVPSVNVRPGSRFIGLYRPAEGHYAVRTVTVPILNAEHSGPSACGFGVPADRVEVDLQQAGASVAGASAPTRFDGYWSAILQDEEGDLIPTAAGQMEQADLGNTVADIQFPDLQVAVDWTNRFVVGTGPANTAFFVSPAVPCPAQQQPSLLSINIGFGFGNATDADGAFQSFIPPFIDSAGGLELAFFDANDHRWFRHVRSVAADLFIRTPEVRGQANSLEEVDVTLSMAGDTLGGAVTRADGYGNFSVSLVDAHGGPSRIEAGDTVTITAGAQTAGIAVPDLSFDWSASAGRINGQTVPGGSVQLSLRLQSGQVLNIERTADDTGAFGFTSTDVPPRAAWNMDDVFGVRTALRLPGGHRVIDQTTSFEGPLQPAGPAIYLPAAFKQGGAASSADALRAVRPTALRAAAPDPAVRFGQVIRSWRLPNGPAGQESWRVPAP